MAKGKEQLETTALPAPGAMRETAGLSHKRSAVAHAYIKGIDSMPRKTAIVASLVRNRYVADALVILEHTPRRAAKAVKKAIESAKANLLDTGSIDVKTIAISRISVTAGTRIRRYVPASRGRALPYEKISSNIFVEVVGEEKQKKVNQTDGNAKKASVKEKK
ncbi:uL22 family ribosomal protein [Christensenellaceae bacterium OttesenSCG-928-L17]|nr:uL22 family ribosomal protein [Christensenellaceae bacterium OttesenSCG-928-L17]